MVKLPKIGRKEDSIRKYFAAVNQALVNGELKPREAEVLIRGARGALDAIKQSKGLSETDDLREMLEEAKELTQSRDQKIVSDRLNH